MLIGFKTAISASWLLKWKKKLVPMQETPLDYNTRSFATVATGDETCVHFYEPKRKYKDKIWKDESFLKTEQIFSKRRPATGLADVINNITAWQRVVTHDVYSARLSDAEIGLCAHPPIQDT